MGSNIKNTNVAVIIPCYNSATYLKETVDSVLSQDYETIEIIAIDDGSTDNTIPILSEYVPRLKLLTHPGGINKGQYPSLNLGLRNTSAEYIAFLDSDDLWATQKISKQVSILNKFQDVGLVYTNCDAIDKNGSTLFHFLKDFHTESNLPENILLDCYIQTPSTVMVRRSVLNKAGFFSENFPASGDHDMWIRLSEITNFYYIPLSLTSYRIHSEQMSQTKMQRMWEDGFTVLHNACKRYPYPLNIKRKRFAVLYYRLGYSEWINRHYFKSLIKFFLAGLTDPMRGLEFIEEYFSDLHEKTARKTGI